MNKSLFHSLWIASFFGTLVSCGNSTSINAPETEGKKKDAAVLVETATSSVLLKPSKYEDVLKKFKLISFDTLKVYFESEDKFYEGKELSTKEARFLPISVFENYNGGKLSGIFACYQFQIDSTTIGLIARTPSEYESSSIKLFCLDTKNDKISSQSIELGQSFGDAGAFLSKTSWIFYAMNGEVQALIYMHYSSHDWEDTLGLEDEEEKNYFLINLKPGKLDTIYKNSGFLKKRFKKLLKKHEDLGE